MFLDLPRNWLSQKGLRAVVFVKNICQSHRFPAGLWHLDSGLSGEAGLVVQSHQFADALDRMLVIGAPPPREPPHPAIGFAGKKFVAGHGLVASEMSSGLLDKIYHIAGSEARQTEFVADPPVIRISHVEDENVGLKSTGFGDNTVPIVHMVLGTATVEPQNIHWAVVSQQFPQVRDEVVVVGRGVFLV